MRLPVKVAPLKDPFYVFLLAMLCCVIGGAYMLRDHVSPVVAFSGIGAVAVVLAFFGVLVNSRQKALEHQLGLLQDQLSRKDEELEGLKQVVRENADEIRKLRRARARGTP